MAKTVHLYDPKKNRKNEQSGKGGEAGFSKEKFFKKGEPRKEKPRMKTPEGGPRKMR